jgi:uncharacterized protein
VSRYPTYAPDFAVHINGDPLPPMVRAAVIGVSYQDGQNEADRVEINIANPNLVWLRKHIRGLGFQPFPTGIRVGAYPGINATPSGVFDMDNKLELAMGYAPDPLEPMFEGEITGIEASFPNGGMPTMKVVALDYLNRLARGTKSRGFGLLPDFLIASILSAESLLVPTIDPAITGASTALAAINFIFGGSGRKQPGVSDLQLLQAIADDYDADFWVDGNILYLSRFIKEYEPRLKLTWGENLQDFSPRLSTVGQVAGVSVRFTLREIPLSFLVTVFWDFDREHLGISIVPGQAAAGAAAVGGPNFTIVDEPISSPADIAASALSIYRTLRKKLNSRLTASGSVIGDPRIRAGAVVRLEGLGEDFSGDYRVTSASHQITEGGYATSVELAREILI